jgi:hypothetical protein
MMFGPPIRLIHMLVERKDEAIQRTVFKSCNRHFGGRMALCRVSDNGSFKLRLIVGYFSVKPLIYR